MKVEQQTYIRMQAVQMFISGIATTQHLLSRQAIRHHIKLTRLYIQAWLSPDMKALHLNVTNFIN